MPPAPADNPPLLQPGEITPAADRVRAALAELDAILLGQPELHRMVMVGVLSRGHILLEGLPGTGKTALIRSLGQLLHLEFKRVQFTPDLMPSDILGATILQEDESTGRRVMQFEPGPIFTNILLADEINRASPKTQSALLEAMQERRVTIMGQTRDLPGPFFVMASQNPIELEGTYPLPEAQLDRFLFKLNVTGVDVETVESIIRTRRRGEPPVPKNVMSHEELDQLFDVMDRIVLPRPVARYISRLVAATHPESPEASERVRTYVSFGGSARAAIAMAEAARAVALIDGRPTVGFEDVAAVAGPVLNHRVILNYQARYDKVSAADVVRSILDSLDEASLNLPRGVELEKVA